MSADLRRGACPALDAPMPTGDGLLVRLSPSSGAFSPNDLIRLGESALSCGNGIVEITARGSVQFRGFSETSVARFAEDVRDAGISVRTGVPVDAGPLAGLDPAEITDPRGLAETIRRRIADAGLAERLGPKVSVVVDGGGSFALDSVSADIRLEAVRETDATSNRFTVRWRIALAGNSGSAHSISVLDESDAANEALSILSEIAKLGPTGRARSMLDGQRSTLPPSGPPPPPDKATGHGRPFRSSSRDGVIAFDDGSLIRPLLGHLLPVGEKRSEAMPQPPSPFGERTRGDGRVGKGVAQIGRPYPLADHRLALTLALPFGQIDARDLIALAQNSPALGITEFRPAPRHRLILICEPDASIDAILRTAQTCCLITTPADPRLAVDACTGAPGCASGHFETKAVAATIAHLMDREPRLASPAIHVSGCAKGCARQKRAALTLVGGENGVGLVANGTARDTPSTYTTPEKAAELAVEHIRAMRGIDKSLNGDGRAISLPGDRPRSSARRLAEPRPPA